MTTKKTTLTFITILYFVFGQAQIGVSEAVKYNRFQIGDKAPPLKAVKWVMGKPILFFDTAFIYVIEFGATWCAPCNASIPLLTKLSEKYANKVSIIGVEIWENGPSSNSTDISYENRVEKYVSSLKGKIGYAIAVDDPQQTIANTWMRAAGQSTLPKTFLLDQNGILRWIGEPDDLDSVIKAMIAGTFNSQAEVIRQKDERQLLDSYFDRIWKAKEEGDIHLALASIDSLIKAYPKKLWLYYEKYRVLANSDDSLAFSLIKEMLKTNEFDTFMLHLGQVMVDQRNPDLNLVVEVADRGLKTAITVDDSAYLLDVKARAYFKMGDFQKAVDTEQEGINVLLKEEKVSGSQNLNKDIKGLTSRVDRFKKKLADKM